MSERKTIIFGDVVAKEVPSACEKCPVVKSLAVCFGSDRSASILGKHYDATTRAYPVIGFQSIIDPDIFPGVPQIVQRGFLRLYDPDAKNGYHVAIIDLPTCRKCWGGSTTETMPPVVVENTDFILYRATTNGHQ